jgi:hypothetical protein
VLNRGAGAGGGTETPHSHPLPWHALLSLWEGLSSLLQGAATSISRAAAASPPHRIHFLWDGAEIPLPLRFGLSHPIARRLQEGGARG